MTSLGSVGLWSGIGQIGSLPAPAVREVAREIERLGFTTLWISESRGREVFAQAAILLSATERIVVASGVANVWARDPTAMTNGARTLAEAFPGRFVLGVGVSHRSVVEVRGHEYRRPLAEMRRYLENMAAVDYRGPEPAEAPPVLVGALGPKMLRLAATHAAGAHPYFVPVAHTALARSVMGPDALLAPEQAVVVEEDPIRARTIARLHMRRYLSLDNYVRNLVRLGWAAEDVAGEGSDDLVDALVAWGPPRAAAERVADHLRAGADHVAVQVLGDGAGTVPLDEITTVAEALGLTRGH